MRRIYVLALAAILTATLITPVKAESVTATLTDDTYYNIIGGPNPAYGSSSMLEAGLRIMTFLKFNISSIPDGVLGITAMLELYATYGGVVTPHSVAVYQSDNTAWNEYAPPQEVYPWFELAVLDLAYVSSEAGWYEWIVTDAIVGTLSNSTDLVTLILCYPEAVGMTTPSVSFTSKEGSMAEMPKLTIFWEVIPEFESAVVMALLLVGVSIFAIVVKKQVS